MKCTKVILPLLMLLATSNVLAQSSRQRGPLYVKDLNLSVAGSKTTYLELIRQVLTDLAVDDAQVDVAIAHTTVPFKHLSEDSEPRVLEGDIKLENFRPQWIKSDGRRILLLQFDVAANSANQGMNYEGEATFLAAFSTESTMKLLDVRDIKTDRFTAFWETSPVFHLTSGTDSFLVYSTHSNAGQSYEDLAMLFLNHDRISTITNIFIFNTQGCGASFAETPHFRVLPGASRKYPKISVNVKVKKETDPSECDRPTRGYTRYYKAVYFWDAAKSQYRTSSRQLEALDKFNRNRS